MDHTNLPGLHILLRNSVLYSYIVIKVATKEACQTEIQRVMDVTPPISGTKPFKEIDY